MVASLQVALLGPTSAANSKSDECGLASVYSTTGEETASGEDTQPQDFTGAHRSLPFGTLVHVGNQENGRSVVIRITIRQRDFLIVGWLAITKYLDGEDDAGVRLDQSHNADQ